jgi:hypothetical protein
VLAGQAPVFKLLNLVIFFLSVEESVSLRIRVINKSLPDKNFFICSDKLTISYQGDTFLASTEWAALQE